MKLKVLIIAIFYSLSFNLFAEQVGKIIFLRGEAVVHAGSEAPKPVTLDMPLHEKDTVETKEKSIVKIKLNDNTVMNLGPESKTTIEKFSSGPRINVIQFLRGQMRIKYNEKIKAETEHLELKVPNAALGIRGTDIATSTELINGNLESVNVLVEGHANVTANGLTSPLQMSPGEGFSSATKAISKINPANLAELTKNPDQLINNDFIKKFEAPRIDSKPTEAVQKEAAQKEVAKEAATTTAQSTGTQATVGSTGLSATQVGVGVGAVGGVAEVAGGAAANAGASAGGAAVGAATEVTGGIGKLVTKAITAPIGNAAGAANAIANPSANEKVKEEATKILVAPPIKKPDQKISEDIQEAINTRDEMRKKNKCYYWVYYKVQVSGLYYHSRKTRGCNEYDNDLD